MARPPPPLLRHLLHRFLPSHPPTAHPSIPSPLPPVTILRFLSSLSPAAPATVSDVAHSIAAELQKISSSLSTDLPGHLSLHFSDVRFTPSLLCDVLTLSPPTAGRAAADLFRHLAGTRCLPASDPSLALLIRLLARRHDFKAIHELLHDFPRAVGDETLSTTLRSLASAGRPAAAVRLFESLGKDLNVPRDPAALSALVTALCAHGFTGYAERAVKAAAAEIFPDVDICNALIGGYCTELKLGEARRLMEEILRGGFELSTPAYNSILDCVCRLSRKKDPLQMQHEAEKILLEMESAGIPRNARTFHALIYNLCKIRKTEDAMKLFQRMPEWGCSAEADTYLVLIRSLYQAARVSEGDEMIGWMRSAGFGSEVDRKAYYGFIKILCGIERVDHAMKVFRMMKGYGHAPGIKTYDLLIGKLAAHNQGDRANALFKEAVARGVPVTPNAYKVDPRFVKQKKVKQGKKRETLPEKMARKRKRLKKLRMSFVKKPRSMRRVI
ncbi:putative tetratricopeptide-like helical domain superfamily [Dioscorea sansibarensis]